MNIQERIWKNRHTEKMLKFLYKRNINIDILIGKKVEEHRKNGKNFLNIKNMQIYNHCQFMFRFKVKKVRLTVWNF